MRPSALARSIEHLEPSHFVIKRLRGAESNYVQGTAFENRSLDLLSSRLSMSLRRIGGAGDGGIDLLGWWWLPPITTSPSVPLNNDRRRIRVLAQCKAHNKKSGPTHVREMEGVMHRHIATGGNGTGMVAMVISQAQFTPGTLKRAHSSPIPLFLLHLPRQASVDASVGEETAESAIGDLTSELGAAFWNPALSTLLGRDMEMRWERSGKGGRPGLWWKGRRLENWTPDAEQSVGLDEELTESLK